MLIHICTHLCTACTHMYACMLAHMCTCACMHAHIDMNMQVRAYTCACIHMQRHAQTCACIHVCAHRHAHVHRHEHACAGIHMQACTRAQTLICVHTCTQTCTHTCIYAHVCRHAHIHACTCMYSHAQAYTPTRTCRQDQPGLPASRPLSFLPHPPALEKPRPSCWGPAWSQTSWHPTGQWGLSGWLSLHAQGLRSVPP